MPSGYEFRLGFNPGDAEHPWDTEPLIAGGAEYEARYNAALAYTTDGLIKLLGPWYRENGSMLKGIEAEELPEPALHPVNNPLYPLAGPRGDGGTSWGALRFLGDSKSDELTEAMLRARRAQRNP
jgi:hypothetical protein